MGKASEQAKQAQIWLGFDIEAVLGRTEYSQSQILGAWKENYLK